MKEKKKWSHLQERFVLEKHWSDFWQKYIPSYVPEDAIKVHVKEDFSVSIAEGGRLFELKGQSMTGFKGVMKPRACIRTFSRKSRWELQKRMAVIDECGAGMPDFLTMTYPNEWSDDWRVWKRDLKVFAQAMQRRWPDLWGVWRLEFQQRGAPHFHCLLWDGPKMESMQVLNANEGKIQNLTLPDCMSEHNKAVNDWVRETWYRIVGSRDPKHLGEHGARFEAIKSWNGVVYYASKYLAKLPDGNWSPVEYTGRFWGVFQSAKWKTWIHKQNVSPAVFYMLRRVLRKKRESLIGHKKHMEPKAGITDISLNHVAGFKLLEWAYREVQEMGGESKHAPF